MKIFITECLFLFIFSSLFAQTVVPMASKKWQTNFVVGAENDQAVLMKNRIELTPATDNPFGYFFEVKENGDFLAFNQGPCGNECRTKVFGRIYPDENGALTLFVDKIEYHKMCIDTPSKVVRAVYGVYSCVPEEDGFVLTRLNQH